MTIVAPSIRIDGDGHLFNYLMDHTLEFDQLYWAGFVYEKLRSGIQEWTLNECSPITTIQGCVLFLELFYWIRFTMVGVESPSKPHEWTNALVSQRVEMEEKLFSGFGRATSRSVCDLRPDDLQDSLTVYVVNG